MAENAQMQEVFDRVARHLLTQNETAGQADPDEGFMSCRYQTEKNGRVLKCAVGCLISDAAYAPMLEGRKATDKSVLKALAVSGIDVSSKMTWLLEDLQCIHDNHEPSKWPTRLRRAAVGYGLSDAVVNELRPE